MAYLRGIYSYTVSSQIILFLEALLSKTDILRNKESVSEI